MAKLEGRVAKKGWLRLRGVQKFVALANATTCSTLRLNQTSSNHKWAKKWSTHSGPGRKYTKFYHDAEGRIVGERVHLKEL